LGTAGVKRAHPPSLAPAVLVERELELVEERIHSLITSRESRLTDIARYLVDGGGKRVRPTVTLMIFRACGGREFDDVVDVAVALELIHSASLLHDDIIDGSSVRRGRDSALRKFGTADTLVAGDFLFSRAFQLCGRFDEQLIHWAAEACIMLTEGEIMQSRFRHNSAVTFADYLEIITCKTASLFETGARTAASLAKAPEAVVAAMAHCGRHVGLTFQMVDDLLDVNASEEELGKPIGLDLRDGNPSLPIVLALQRDAEVAELFGKAELSELDFELLLDKLRRPEISAEGERLALQHAREARAAMASLHDSPFRDSLLALIDQLMQRGS
jgi:octaprenyl-diphosphate synthase